MARKEGEGGANLSTSSPARTPLSRECNFDSPDSGVGSSRSASHGFLQMWNSRRFEMECYFGMFLRRVSRRWVQNESVMLGFWR